MQDDEDHHSDGDELDRRLEKLRLSLHPENTLRPLLRGYARNLRPDALEHEARRILQERRDEPGDGERDHHGEEEAPGLESDDRNKLTSIGPVLEGPPPRVVEHLPQDNRQPDRLIHHEETGDHQYSYP